MAVDNMLRREQHKESIIFSVQLTSKIGDLNRLIHTLAICDDHTDIHIFPVTARFAAPNSASGTSISGTNCMYRKQCTAGVITHKVLYYVTPSHGPKIDAFQVPR